MTKANNTINMFDSIIDAIISYEGITNCIDQSDRGRSGASYNKISIEVQPLMRDCILSDINLITDAEKITNNLKNIQYRGYEFCIKIKKFD